MTSILSDDIITALLSIGLIQEIELAGGSTQYVIYAPPALVAELISKYKYQGHLLDPERLHWTPLYVTDPKKDKWALKAKMIGKENNKDQGRASPFPITTSSAALAASSSIGGNGNYGLNSNLENPYEAGGGNMNVA